MIALIKKNCSELKFYSSPEDYTQPLVAKVVTFRMSGVHRISLSVFRSVSVQRCHWVAIKILIVSIMHH